MSKDKLKSVFLFPYLPFSHIFTCYRGSTLWSLSPRWSVQSTFLFFLFQGSRITYIVSTPRIPIPSSQAQSSCSTARSTATSSTRASPAKTVLLFSAGFVFFSSCAGSPRQTQTQSRWNYMSSDWKTNSLLIGCFQPREQRLCVRD